jgi:hypothetical protein
MIDPENFIFEHQDGEHGKYNKRNDFLDDF